MQISFIVRTGGPWLVRSCLASADVSLISLKSTSFKTPRKCQWNKEELPSSPSLSFRACHGRVCCRPRQRATGQAGLREGGVGGDDGRTSFTKEGASLDFFRPLVQLAQFLSNRCRWPDGVTRSPFPLPATSACLLRRRHRIEPRRSCGRARPRAQLGRRRQSGKTSARPSRR